MTKVKKKTHNTHVLLDAELYKAAKKKAKSENKTMTQVMEEGLRLFLKAPGRNKFGCVPSEDVCLEHSLPLIAEGKCEDAN